ncbi:hypothetical protein MASR1M36_01970 [Candidatus Cloacimonadaceae bacterium]|jgi:predicted nucleotidyltransferase
MAASTNRAEVIKIVERYAAALKADLKLDAVYLFGSYARGDASPDSDIDVMVVSPDFAEDVIENQMLLLRVRRKIDLRIEPHPIRSEELEHSILFSLVAEEALKVV